MRMNASKNALKNIARSAAAFFLAASAAMPAHAQVYQWGYGSGSQPDAARGGVLSLANGDAVTVGETKSHFPGDYNIYLMKSRCEEAVWGWHYDIGGDDIGHKVRSTSDGGFIIVGETDNTGNCCLRDDIFLMKVDANGALQWTRTYGGNGDDIGSDVKVVGDGYVVAGRSNSFGQGDYDAYLMKTDLSGNLIWAKVYGGQRIDYFMSCAIGSNGDIIATGSTKSFTFGGDADLLLTRVMQANGSPIMPGLPVTFGGSGDEIGWSVVECANGDIAVAGNTTSMGGNSEGYLLRTSNVLLPLCDRTYGSTNAGGWDEFTELTLNSSGNFLVTGLFHEPVGGFGSYDMFVGEFGSCFTKINGVIHGGRDNDQGWGIVEAQGSAQAPAYIVAGLTESFSPSMDMYLVRQLTAAIVGCNMKFIETVTTEPRFPAVFANTISAKVNASCAATARPRAEWIEYLICSDCIGGENRRDPSLGDPNGADPNFLSPTLGLGERTEVEQKNMVEITSVAASK